MKSSYPNYSKTGTMFVYDKLKGKQKKIYEDYMTEISSAGSGKARIYKIYRPNFLAFIDIIEKPLDKLKPEDIKKYWALVNDSDREVHTKNHAKHTVKRFLKWYYKKDIDMRDILDELKLKNHVVNRKKINKNNLLTEKEIERMLKACKTPREKAQFVVEYMLALRPHELRLAKWKQIDFDNKTFHIYSSKTNSNRELPLNEDCIVYLKNWKNYSENIEGEDYIFYSPVNKEEPISVWSFCYVIKELSRRAKIKKYVYPYLLRHTRLTELKIRFNVDTADRLKFGGHSANSKMDAVYNSMDDKDMQNNIISRVYKFEELSPEDKVEFEKEIAKQNKEIDKIKNILNVVIKERLGKTKMKKVKIRGETLTEDIDMSELMNEVIG